MSTLRDDLLSVIDDARSVVDDLGLRRRDVEVVTRTRTGTGLSKTWSDAVLTLSPRPKVSTVSERQAQADAMLNVGDIVVSKISGTYTRAQLDPAATATTEAFWRITDRESDTDGQADYRIVKIEQRSFGWTVVLRSMNRVQRALSVAP